MAWPMTAEYGILRHKGRPKNRNSTDHSTMQIVYTAANRCPHIIGKSAISDLIRLAATITALTGPL